MPASPQANRRAARPPGNSSDHRSQIFSALGWRLSEAATISQVAEIVVQAADELVGWDACCLDLFAPESDTTTCVLAMDIIAGRRTAVTPSEVEATPSPGFRRVICDGPRLILREGAPRFAPELFPLGIRPAPPLPSCSSRSVTGGALRAF